MSLMRAFMRGGVTRAACASRGLSCAAVACGLMLAAHQASAQAEFAQTLNWGSGLIDIPTAWVSPLSGDFSINWSAKMLQTSPALPQYNNSLSAKGALQLALFGGQIAHTGKKIVAEHLDQDISFVTLQIQFHCLRCA